MIKVAKISKGISIRKAVKTTKLCPFCGRAVIAGLYHITIADQHKAEPIASLQGPKAKPYVYSSNTIRIHVDCFEAMSKQVKNAIRSMRGNLKQNKLQVGANSI